MVVSFVHIKSFFPQKNCFLTKKAKVKINSAVSSGGQGKPQHIFPFASASGGTTFCFLFTRARKLWYQWRHNGQSWIPNETVTRRLVALKEKI